MALAIIGKAVVANVIPIILTGTLIKFLAKLIIATEPAERPEAITVNPQNIASSTGWPNIFGIIRFIVFLNSGVLKLKLKRNLNPDE